MEKRTARFSFGFLAVSAVGIALYSLRYLGVPFGVWPLVDAGITGVIARMPFRALMHMLIAPIPLLVGPFQFIPSLRARHPKVHRYLGRIYVAGCVIAGIGALAVAPHASGGPIAGWGFGILAVLWIATALGGWWAAMQRRFELHRLLMRLSYAMTFGAVTLRLQIPLGLMLGYTSYSAMSVWLAYTSWIPNVIAVLVYSGVAWPAMVSWVSHTRWVIGVEVDAGTRAQRRCCAAGDCEYRVFENVPHVSRVRAGCQDGP